MIDPWVVIIIIALVVIVGTRLTSTRPDDLDIVLVIPSNKYSRAVMETHINYNIAFDTVTIRDQGKHKLIIMRADGKYVDDLRLTVDNRDERLTGTTLMVIADGEPPLSLIIDEAKKYAIGSADYAETVDV